MGHLNRFLKTIGGTMRKSFRQGFAFGLLRTAFAATLLIVLMAANLAGQIPGSSSPPDNISSSIGQTGLPEYRFVFFPEETISFLPITGLYLPMPAEKFHRLMDKTRETGQPEGDSDSRYFFNSLKLSARLDNRQLVSGKGVMHIDSGEMPPDSSGLPVPLSPFRLPLSNPVWSNGKPAQLGLGRFGETMLWIPPDASELTFEWTLRRETEIRNELIFSLDMPRFLRTELILDLPDDKKPIVPFGLVRRVETSDNGELSADSVIPQNYRRWQITVNGSPSIRLTVAPDETSESFLHSIGVSGLHSYDLSLSGMELNTRFFLEKSDFILSELTLELDKPLSLLSVKTGDRVLAWTEISSDSEDENVTRFHLAIPYLESGIREMQIQTFCSVRTDQTWDLPGVHLRSSLLLWNETRNIVHVNRPLLTRQIIAPFQRQVSPTSGVDETESDHFVFQAFDEDSPLGIVLGLKQTLLNLESGTSFQWGEREINARAILDLSVNEGQIQQLELEVDANWTIDLMEASDTTRVANYFVADVEQEAGNEPSPHAMWVVPLRQVIDPSLPLRLIVQLRRPLTADEQTTSFALSQKRIYPCSDFMPIRVRSCREGEQLIAFEPGQQYRVMTDDLRESSALSLASERIRERFDAMPQGTVFSIGKFFKNSLLEIESAKPTYEMTAMTNLVFQNGILEETSRFTCTPADDTQVDRLTVRFSKTRQADDDSGWTWHLETESESSQQITTKKLASLDSTTDVWETWELELPPSRSTPFEVTATRTVPFDSSQTIPLPFFPDASDGNAFVQMETRDATLYRIINNPTKSVSPHYPTETDVDVAALTNHAIHGFYQYPVNGNILLPENAMIVLEPLSVSTDRQDGAANIWSLTLHTHDHPSGEVISFAVMALENRKLDRLKIGLPPQVSVEQIRNLWIDREKAAWTFVPEGNGNGNLYVDLPSQRRYLTLTLEYACQSDPLPDKLSGKLSGKLSVRRMSQPAMPDFDVPVFTRQWYAWYPPQYQSFDLSMPRNAERQSFFDRNATEFDLFSSRLWFGSPVPTGIKEEITACSQGLLQLLEAPMLEELIRQQRATSGTPETSSLDPTFPGNDPSAFALTWGELFASGLIEDMAAGDGNSQRTGHHFTVMIDSDSLAQAGIFPLTPVFSISSVGNDMSREKGQAVLEQSHFAVIFDDHHNLLVTSALTAAKLRPQLVSVHAGRFWYYPLGSIAGIVPLKNTSTPTGFLSPLAWQNNAQSQQIASHFFHTTVPSEVDMPGWTVREMVCDSEFSPAILLIEHDRLLVWKSFVFFFIMLVSWQIRPCHLIWVIVLSVVALCLLSFVRLFPPYFLCLVPGVFWGMVCAAAFGMIRHLRSNRRNDVHSSGSEQTTIMSSPFRDDDSELGEIRPSYASLRHPGKQHDTAEISNTDIDSASSKSLFLLFLVTTISGLLIAGAGSLSAQPTTSDSSAIPSSGLFPQNVTPETPSSVPDGIRGLFDANDLSIPYEVYVPYNSSGRIGDHYYLPDLLNSLLLQMNDKEMTSSGNWRICKASYAGTLSHNPVQNEVTLTQLRAIFDLELDDASAVVRLPDMPVLPDGIRCDNRLIQPIIDKNEYVLAVSGRGSHRLEALLQPTPTVNGSSEMPICRFDLSIPPVPDSTLELTLPVATFPVEILQSLGQVTRSSDKLRASLGPSKRLSVAWPMTPPLSSGLSVSQFFRLSVAPDQAKLHAQFRFTIPSGSIRQVILTVDPRYKLDGEYHATEAVIASVEPVPGVENLQRITFRQPVTKNVTIEADFVPRTGIGNFSGIGRLPMPRFSAADANVRIDHSWLGVSSDPSTEVELPVSNVDTKFFENARGFPDEPVHHAFDLRRPQENWFLTVKSRPVFKQIDQRQWLLFRHQSILTYLEEEVTPFYNTTMLPTATTPLTRETIPVFSYEITLPEGFHCEKVEVKDANGVPWEKLCVEQQDRNLVIFFKEPIHGKYTVSLLGTVPSKSPGEIPFPQFTHDEQTTVQSTVFCHRDTSVLVRQTLDKQSVQWIDDNLPCPMPTFPTGYFLSAFRVNSTEQFHPGTVSMMPNKPEITGIMVSRLERNYPFNDWNMIVTWDVTISQGEMGQLSLFIPFHYNEPLSAFHFDSRLQKVDIIQKSKNDGTEVQITPRDPVSGKHSFEIQFPIGGTLDLVSVPYVRFLHDCDLEQYVALPDSSGEKPLTWSLVNLSPSDSTPSVRPLDQRVSDTPSRWPIDMESIYRYYRANQQEYSAKISSLNESASVSCHDVTCFVKRNGFCFGISLFDIHENDAPWCDIVLPPKSQLIQVQVNDVFPLPERVDDATIRVELFPDIPVQRLTLVYCSRHDASKFEPSWSLMLPFPQILSFPVSKTLWEVYYEPLPTEDTPIHARANVLYGSERLSSNEHELESLAQTDAGNLRVRMELARLNQMLSLFHQMPAQSQATETPFHRQAAWSGHWNGPRKRAAHFLPEKNADKVSWENALFLDQSIASLPNNLLVTERGQWETSVNFAWIKSCFSRNQTPQTVYDELVNQYKNLSGGTSSPSLLNELHWEDTPQTDWESYFFRSNFWNDSTGVRYLAGVAPHGMTDLTLVFHSKTASPLYGVYFRYILAVTVCLAMMVMAVHRNLRQFYRRFSALFVIALIVFCWFFVHPNLIGWTVLLVLLVSALRIQWDQMRTATTAIMQNNP